MPLTWNEIRTRAHAFVKEWEDETREHAEAKSFWDGFFNVFGLSRRRVASFEEAVKKEGGGQGFIDLFWPGVLLVEHKSRGKDLEKAAQLLGGNAARRRAAACRKRLATACSVGAQTRRDLVVLHRLLSLEDVGHPDRIETERFAALTGRSSMGCDMTNLPRCSSLPFL